MGLRWAMGMCCVVLSRRASVEEPFQAARFSQPSPADAKRALRIFRDSEGPSRYAAEHGDEITEKYSGRWVAITEEGAIASSKSHPALLRRLRPYKFRTGQVYVKYVFPADQVLLL